MSVTSLTRAIICPFTRDLSCPQSSISIHVIGRQGQCHTDGSTGTNDVVSTADYHEFTATTTSQANAQVFFLTGRMRDSSPYQAGPLARQLPPLQLKNSNKSRSGRLVRQYPSGTSTGRKTFLQKKKKLNPKFSARRTGKGSLHGVRRQEKAAKSTSPVKLLNSKLSPFQFNRGLETKNEDLTRANR